METQRNIETVRQSQIRRNTDTEAHRGTQIHTEKHRERETEKETETVREADRKT